MPLPTQHVEIQSWRGINAHDPPDNMPPDFLADCENCDFDEAGVIEKRRGARRVMNLGGRINLIYDFQSQQGFYGATDQQRTVIVAGGTLYVVAALYSGGSVDASFATVDALHYATTDNNGICYITTEAGGAPPKMLWLHASTGVWYFISTALNPPLAAPTVSVGGVGELIGEYRFRYTYEDYWGNESNPSDASAPVELGALGTGEYANVAVVASTDPSVQFINLYCLPPNSSLYQFAGQHPNTSATLAHWISDAQVLGSAALEYDHFTAPAGKYVTIYNDMLCVAGEPGLPDTVYVSNSRYHRQFAVGTDWARAVTGDGQGIKGFAGAFNQLMVGKADSLFIGDGADNTTFTLRPHNQNYGVLGGPSMTFVNQRLTFFSDDGIYEDDSLVPTELSILIRNKMRTLNPGNLATNPPKQYAANNKYYKQTFWSVRRAGGVGPNDTLFVWNYERKVWTIWSGNAATCLGSVQNQDDYEFMYGGDSAGNVFQYTPPNGGSPNSDNIAGTPVAINAFAETPWLNLPRLKGMDDWERRRTIPRFIQLYVSGESGGSTIGLTTTYYVDFDMTVQGTFSTTHAANAWPVVLPAPQMIRPWGGPNRLFKWVKFRFSNNEIDCHFKIHKVVFGFKAKPSID